VIVVGGCVDPGADLAGKLREVFRHRIGRSFQQGVELPFEVDQAGEVLGGDLIAVVESLNYSAARCGGNSKKEVV
jgi:hypothetical protein